MTLTSLLVAAVSLAGCGIIELGTIGVAGEVAEPATAVDGDDWELLLVIEPNTIPGVTADVVAISFDRDELACVDGAAIAPDALEVGWTVNFDRVDDEVHGDEPPTVQATSVAADCPADAELDG